jgi:hypothetical protein
MTQTFYAYMNIIKKRKKSVEVGWRGYIRGEIRTLWFKNYLEACLLSGRIK